MGGKLSTKGKKKKQRKIKTNSEPNDSQEPRYEESFEESNSSTSDEEEKCYDPGDPTLRFVDGEDEMDFLGNDYKSLRAKMSCGHAVTPMSLTDWCGWLLEQGECRFECGNCDREWSFEEVCKMALLTPEEVEEFEKKIFLNAAKDFLDIKEVSIFYFKNLRIQISLLTISSGACDYNSKFKNILFIILLAVSWLQVSCGEK
ncbi:uncharacterized protein AB9X84_015739 [Acanthopagrus schlegelii]